MFLNPVAITIDNNYMQHACVMLRSLDANITSPVNVYCVFDNLSHQNISLMQKEFKNSHVSLYFLPFDSRVLPVLPIKSTDHVTSAAFFRIWLPHLFKDVKQMLFMDTDIIINSDISEILNLDIGDYPLAAVSDRAMFDEKKRALGMEDGQAYINSGILLLNLEYFRQHGLTEKIAGFITTYPQLCEFWDQDAINAIIKGNFYQLNCKFNVQSSFYENPTDPLVIAAIKEPSIVHYTGGGNSKPWYYHNKHPERQLYYKYLRLTAFRFYYPPDLPRSWHLFRKLRFIFSTLKQ